MMASTLVVLLHLSAGLFMVKAGIGGDVVSSISDECTSYYTSNREYKEGFKCFFLHCCGSCDHKYCCFDEDLKLTESVQHLCDIRNSDALLIVAAIVVIVLIALFITCCCCPCCCIYKMCRRPRPVAGAQVTTVTNTNVIQQQSAVQGIQYPQYQPVLTQPGYSQPMQMRPYQGQPCAPGAPPPYHMATSPANPTSQSAYDEGQAMYPMQPPAHPGPVYKPPETSNQLAYNPTYMQPPNTGY